MSLLNKVDDEKFAEIVQTSFYYKEILSKLGYAVSIVKQTHIAKIKYNKDRYPQSPNL